jgi:hypothetical protein
LSARSGSGACAPRPLSSRLPPGKSRNLGASLAKSLGVSTFNNR